MARLFWSPEALRNLESIGDFAREYSPEHTEELLNRLVGAAVHLQSFPHLGRRLPSGAAELRDFVIDAYHVIYEVDGQNLNIVTVMHGSMDVVARLRRLGY